MRYDLLEFWVEYPLEIVPSAGPRDSLHYYVFSDRLSWGAMELDQNGIPLYLGRTFGRTYSPSYIAWYGLIKLQEYLRGLNPEGKCIFLNQTGWLLKHHLKQSDGCIIWPWMTDDYAPIDWREGSCVLKAPWASAMHQGHAISALIRAFRITGDPTFIDISRQAASVFAKPIDEGGLRYMVDGHVLYADLPGYPTPHILDGFLVGLLGLCDLYQETQEKEILLLLEQGIDGLKHLLPYWTYRQKWTWYGAHSYLCSRTYHTQNRLLLLSLARIRNETMLSRYVDLWDLEKLTWLGKLEVFFVLLLTKNLVRYRNRTWRQRTLLPATSQIHGLLH